MPATPTTRARNTGNRRGGAAAGSWLRGNRRPHRAPPGRAARRAGTCRANRPSTFTANCSTRFCCSERTPMMKKLPRPTASRTMRIWLPGRLSCSTAWRSANDRDRASGAIGPDHRVPARCSTSAVPAKPAATTSPIAPVAGLPHRQRDQRRRRQTSVTSICTASGRRLRGSSRNSSDGFTWRTSSSGTSENSSDTSRPMPTPCAMAGQRQRVDDLDARRGAGEQRREWRAWPAPPARHRAGCRPGRAWPPAPRRRRAVATSARPRT